MQVNLSDKAVAHIQTKGGKATVDLISLSSWAGTFAEVSVDTNMGRRNLSPYQVLKQDGIELLLLPQLVMHVRNVDIDLKEFLFFKNLRATLELEDGQVLGRKPSAA